MSTTLPRRAPFSNDREILRRKRAVTNGMQRRGHQASVETEVRPGLVTVVAGSGERTGARPATDGARPLRGGRRARRWRAVQVGQRRDRRGNAPPEELVLPVSAGEQPDAEHPGASARRANPRRRRRRHSSPRDRRSAAGTRGRDRVRLGAAHIAAIDHDHSGGRSSAASEASISGRRPDVAIPCGTPLAREAAASATAPGSGRRAGRMPAGRSRRVALQRAHCSGVGQDSGRSRARPPG